ncbi:MAG: hypothetical protein RMN51_06390 [Verrucomicrobiota bacterium]|nr:hypothetical protein [Limisphaera sp.]MDW8381719.1 hypothetical protein [Verrucomicrobiota bacterium]
MNDEMKDVALKRLLREARPQAGLPKDFAAGVWRRIELQAQDLASLSLTWWMRLAFAWLEPQRAALILGLAAVLGACTGWVQGRMTAEQMIREHYVATVSPALLLP